MINVRVAEGHEIEMTKRLIQAIFPQAMISISDDDTLVLAEEDGKPLGFAHVIEYEDYVVFQGLGVHPKARGMGIGTLLMDHVMGLSESTYKPIFLRVKPTNPVINLYARFGFMLKKFRGHSLVLVNRANN